MCYVHYICLTWYLRTSINATSLTICQHIQLAMHGFSKRELMCYLGNTVTEECLSNSPVAMVVFWMVVSCLLFVLIVQVFYTHKLAK